MSQRLCVSKKLFSFHRFFTNLIVLDDVSCYAASDFWCVLVLAVIVHKLALRVHQVHDNGMVNLEGGRDQGSTSLLTDTSVLNEDYE